MCSLTLLKNTCLCFRCHDFNKSVRSLSNSNEHAYGHPIRQKLHSCWSH